MLKSWVEWTAMQNSIIQNSCWKISSDFTTILFTDKKDIYSAYIENLEESPTVHYCSNQEERCRDKMPAIW